jgi:hypothetical protein
VQGGEAVVERGAADEGRVGGEERVQGIEVPELRRAEVVVLVAGAGAADAVPHVGGDGSLSCRGVSSGPTPPAGGEVGEVSTGRRGGEEWGKERRPLYAFLLRQLSKLQPPAWIPRTAPS